MMLGNEISYKIEAIEIGTKIIAAAFIRYIELF